MSREKVREIFSGRKLVIATMHGKEQVIAPIVEEALGVKCVVPQDFNSDVFGSFSGEIQRAGNQKEAAKKKLLTALKQENADLGIASEGSFGQDPHIPFIHSNRELILLIDTKNEIEIEGYIRSFTTNLDGKYISNTQEALDFAKKIGFPEHGIILKKKKNGKKNIFKDILNYTDLEKTSKQLLSSLFTRKIYIETDMRAYRNPTRMKNIEQASKNLIEHLFISCPQCNTPGFSISNIEIGLPCSLCKSQTDLIKTEIRSCKKCNFIEKRDLQNQRGYADPQYCSYCNP